MRPNNVAILSAANAAVNQTSQTISCLQVFRISAQALFSSATLNGSLQLQVSNDPQIDTPSNWINLGNAVTVTSGASVLIPYQEICFRWVQIVWTAGSGTGTITINFMSLGA